MGMFPKIQSPCPYKDDLAAIMDGSLCRKCKREVHDITHMTDVERRDLLAGCETEICVSYGTLVRAAAATVAVGAAMTAVPAQAQVDDVSAVSSDEESETYAPIVIFAGGLKAPKDAEWEEHQPADLPEMPVISDSSERQA